MNHEDRTYQLVGQIQIEGTIDSNQALEIPTSWETELL